MSRSDPGTEWSLPGFRHALEAALVFGAVGGLADVSYLVSRYPDLGGELFKALRFANAGAAITAIAFFPYLLVLLLVIRPIASTRKWRLQDSLSVLYFLGVLPAAAILCRNVALLVAAESVLVEQVKALYYFVKYLWLFLPVSWAIGYWLARFRTSSPLDLTAGRLSGFAFSAAMFLLVTPLLQQKYLLERANVYSIVEAGRENMVITLGVLAAALVCLPIAIWIAVRLARSHRGVPLLVVWIVALLIPFVPPVLSGPSNPGTPPSGNALDGRAANVVLVSLDTVRYDDIGCFGSEITKTPNLDRLAESSVCFDDAIAPMPLTGPSHASMFTGLEPDSDVGHGVKSNGVPLAEDIPTLATALDEAGYQTGAIIAGFPLASRACGLNRGFHYYNEVFDPGWRSRFLPDQVWNVTACKVIRRLFGVSFFMPSGNTKDANAVTDQAVSWLEEHADKPFFLFVHYFDAHYHYAPPPPFDEMYMPRYDGPYKSRAIDYSHIIKEIPNFAPDDFAYYRALYRGEISFADSEFGRLLEWGNERNLWDNTLLIVVSDHGESFEHDYYFNHSDRVYDAMIHVPLIIRDPDSLAENGGGERIDALVNVSDLFFTVLGFLGVDPPRSAEQMHQGVLGSLSGWDHDLCALIRKLSAGSDQVARQALGWAFVPSQSYAFATTEAASLGRFFCFRFPDWKLIYAPDAAPALPVLQYFDLRRDPDETDDIFPSVDWETSVFPVAPEVLKSWAAEQAAVDVSRMDPEMLEKLRSLGYLH